MKDFARSDDPEVQAQLDRLAALSVPDGRLGLETIRALLARLGDPQDRLPPVFHVAGTNGKGSTCANLRAMLEADGKRVHVATSPHLVRYNERIRIAGTLIEDAQLAALLAEVLDAGEDLRLDQLLDQNEDPGIKNILSRLGLEPLEFDTPERTVKECVRKFKNIQLKTKIKDLKLQRLNAANAGQVERSQELGAQLNEMYSALTH